MSDDPIKVTYTDLADLKAQVLNFASAFDFSALDSAGSDRTVTLS